jgi:hypothetical protein
MICLYGWFPEFDLVSIREFRVFKNWPVIQLWFWTYSHWSRSKRKSTRPLSQLIASGNEQISATQNPLSRIGVTRGCTSKRGRGRGGRSGSVRGGRFPSTQNIDTSEDIAEEACSSNSRSSSNVED